MKVKTANVIEVFFKTLLYIIYVPIALIGIVFGFINKMFITIKEWIDYFSFCVGHKLFLLCDEKDVVKNKDYFKRFTAKTLYEYLKSEEYKRYQENEEDADNYYG